MRVGCPKQLPARLLFIICFRILVDWEVISIVPTGIRQESYIEMLPTLSLWYRGEQLAFTPGDKFQYSNTGMLLLGVIIEKVSGINYFDYVRENIFKKAQMPNTDSYEMDHPVENLAIGYSPSKSNPYGWENNLYKHVIKGGPAGGGFSTVRDLHHFANALINEKLISKASLKLLWTDHSKENYGYGFGVRKDSKGIIVGHSGGFPGLNSNLDIFPESGYIIAVMSNYDRAARPLAQKLNKLVKKELN